MRFSHGWLSEFLSVEISPEELAKKLLMLGFEATSIEELGPGFEGVVVGKVLDVRKHPDADRLSLCSVTDGKETLSIVCGAKNVAAGARVPVARVGAKLPGGRVIGRAKIRGVESQGMICSAGELGLPANGEGILILSPDAAIGADAASLFGRKDYAVDIDITPNRPDCLSHLGLAREISIHLGEPLKLPARLSPRVQGSRPGKTRIDIQDPAACRRYLGREFENVKVGPSPTWLARRLEAVGLRPINNLVDITNYVVFELGHPIHAFDLDKLKGDAVIVRFAKAGEKLKALNGKEYALEPADLVIADASGPVGLAGIIGGEASSITEKTARVFVESAHFRHGLVRRASRRLGLRTDAAYHFERGTDPETAALASDLAAGLILELCGRPSLSSPMDAYPGRREPPSIEISCDRVNRILGASFPAERVEGVLKSIAAKWEPKGKEFLFHPPPHRLDLSTAWDLAEEAARHLGYDQIPDEAGPARLYPPEDERSLDLIRPLRARMAAEGFFEAYNVDFISAAQARILGKEPGDPALAAVANPLSEDQALMRPSLLLGLLQNAVYNLSRGAQGARLFEIGKVYEASRGAPSEKAMIAGIRLGESLGESDHFFGVKGIVEALLSDHPEVRQVGSGGEDPLFHPKASAEVRRNDVSLGRFGLIHPAVLDELGVKVPAAAFVLDLDALGGVPAPRSRFKAFSPFPSVTRDLSIVVDRRTPYEKVKAAVGEAGTRGLDARWSLIDLYEGSRVPKGKKSLTLRLVFSSQDRTLRDEEVEAEMDKILGRLKKDCGARLRS